MIDKLVILEPSASRLIWSATLGIFMACSPFVGLMTWITIPLCWLFGLNTVVAITILYVVNNPFTMIPLMIADYAIGYWITECLFGWELAVYNPSWVDWLNTKLSPYLHDYLGVSDFCFWCYILGGLLFAFLATLICYFPLRYYVHKKLFTPERRIE